MKVVARSTAIMATSALVLSCIANASNPTHDGTRLRFLQSESNIVYVAATDTVIVAYNDRQGVEKLDPKNADNQIDIVPGYYRFGPKDFRYVGQSFMGFSTSRNFGTNFGTQWEAGNPIQPIDPALCPVGSHCPLIMRGDPALATNGQRVLYANIAYTDFTQLKDVIPPPPACGRERGPDALAIARDESGTATFAAPYVLEFRPIACERRRDADCVSS